MIQEPSPDREALPTSFEVVPRETSPSTDQKRRSKSPEKTQDASPKEEQPIVAQPKSDPDATFVNTSSQ